MRHANGDTGGLFVCDNSRLPTRVRGRYYCAVCKHRRDTVLPGRLDAGKRTGDSDGNGTDL
eukprot:2165057-Prymnesium_polylepis.1